jgi:putative RecB family exonuclease
VDTPLYVITHSKVESFRRCRKQFWFEYVSGLEKPPDPASPPGIVGSGVHRAMHLLCDSGEPQVGADALDVYLRMPAHESAGPGTEWHARAFAFYERGCEAHHTIESDDRWAEKDTYAPWPAGRVNVWARVDRIDRLRSGAWQIVDWKTGRSGDDDTTDAQLDLGHLALRTTMRASIAPGSTVSAVAWNLRTGQQRVRVLTRADAVATLRKYAALASRIQATSDFGATPGPHCGFCKWRPSCSDGAPEIVAGGWNDIDPDPVPEPGLEPD